LFHQVEIQSQITVPALKGIKTHFGRYKTEKNPKNANKSVGMSQIVVLYSVKLCGQAGGFRCRGGICYTTHSTVYSL
jgi:hypothetical protein